MTDKLRQAAEMALDAIDEGWLFEDIDKTVAPALRQALAEWTPDDTAYRPDGLSQEELPPVKSYCGGKPNYCEPEMPVDRGAWDDVPDATKWVDELRGDEPSTDVEPIGEIIEAHGLIAVSIPEMPPVGTKLYAQPLLNQTCCGCGLSGGYALYCGWCWSKNDKPVGYVDQSDLDRAGHDFWVSRQPSKNSVPIYTVPPVADVNTS